MSHCKPEKQIDPGTEYPAIPSPSLVEVLTHTQRLVVRLIASGLQKKEVAKALHISVKTVENHVGASFLRLDIHDKVMLTRWAIRAGLVEA